MVKPYRLQVRISEKIYQELLRQSILMDIPISQIVRLKIQDKQIFKAVAEND